MSEYRTVKLEFINDSIFTVLCESKSIIGMEYFNIDEIYKYHIEKNNFRQIIVDSLLKTNRKINDTRPILKPYECEGFCYTRAYNKFPYLEGDTLYISRDVSKLRVGYFTFDKYRRITPEKERVPYVLPEYLDSAVRNFDFQKIKQMRNSSI